MGLCWNTAIISGSVASLDKIELILYKYGVNLDSNINSVFLHKILGVDGSNSEMSSADIRWERQSNNIISMLGDSNEIPLNEFFLKISEVYSLSIVNKYEDDSMDIGGVYRCKCGKVIKHTEHRYLVHRYLEDGLDGLLIDVEESISIGELCDNFLTENGLWAFISKDDKETIEGMYN